MKKVMRNNESLAVYLSENKYLVKILYIDRECGGQITTNSESGEI